MAGGLPVRTGAVSEGAFSPFSKRGQLPIPEFGC
jgi:hypothetical protein